MLVFDHVEFFRCPGLRFVVALTFFSLYCLFSFGSYDFHLNLLLFTVGESVHNN